METCNPKMICTGIVVTEGSKESSPVCDEKGKPGKHFMGLKTVIAKIEWVLAVGFRSFMTLEQK